MDLHLFLTEFQDFVAPKLDTYEQAIYLYIFRHSRLCGIEDICIGFKSARKKMALGTGTQGHAMSENTCYEKLASLEEKGLVERLSTDQRGTRLRLKLPAEVPGLIPIAAELAPPDIEQMDFFDGETQRHLILEREGFRCFYCGRKVDERNYVIEHVESRPQGNNGYRNVVAACRQCNNRKNSSPADDLAQNAVSGGILGRFRI